VYVAHRHCGTWGSLCGLLDLREHAIFTLHNLLEGNPENQAVVEAIKPSGKWDDNGVLQDVPGAVRR
jgi:ataxin-10